MSKNDEAALEANFKSWQEKRFPVPPKDLNVFEYYCTEQFHRSYDLNDSQLKSGLVGGGKDGGVDSMFMFVNGEMVDAESELDRTRRQYQAAWQGTACRRAESSLITSISVTCR